MKKIKDDKKKKVVIKKITIKGAKLIEINNAKGVTLTFEGFNKLPPLLNSKAVPYPMPSKCEITGLPAKYLDPKSKLPYTTLEAFKIIRERYDKTQMELQAAEQENIDQESEEEDEGSATKKSKRRRKKKKKKKGSDSEEDDEQEEEEVKTPGRRRR